MGHEIRFENFGHFVDLMTEDEAIDMINTLYRWDDSSFVIFGTEWKRNPKQRGEHKMISHDGQLVHVISMSKKAIKSGFIDGGRCGGNRPSPTLKMAVFMVLAHELQHANQEEMHVGEASFYGKKRSRYIRRPCEREARSFVDDNMETIAAIAGHTLDSRHLSKPAIVVTKDELTTISETFEGAQEVLLADIIKELKLSKMNNPSNVERVTKMLEDKRIKVVYL